MSDDVPDPGNPFDHIKDMLNHQFLPLFGAASEGLEWDYVQDADASTIREYLVALARGAWTDGEFSGKRPFGSSSWRYEVYAALGDAGRIRYVRDEDGYCEDCDTALGDKLILAALNALAAEPPA